MIAGLNPYSEYVDSGVTWLGEVPVAWDTRRLGRIGRVLKGTGGSKDDDVEAGVPCVRYGDLYTRHRLWIHGTDRYVQNDRAAVYRSIQYGDVLFAASGESMAEIGRSAVNLMDGPAVAGGDILILRPSRPMNPRFMGYACESPSSVAQKSLGGKGEIIVHITEAALRRVQVAVPPLPHQAAIARFLDHADSRIQRLISAKKRLIILQEEEKQAVIQGAVTRGLNPDVPLKPSGVEWLGKVPAHWEVKRLQDLTDPRRPIVYGIVLPGPDVDDGVFIVKGGNCESGRLRPEFLSKTTVEIESRYQRSRLVGGDLVIAIRGGVGAVQQVPHELAGANLTQDAARIAPAHGCLGAWLLVAMRSHFVQQHVRARRRGATISGINIRDLRRIPVPVPPRPEQEAIAHWVNREAKFSDGAAIRARDEIALLRELRTRLISDVVTGKLDVREAAAHLPGDDIGESPLDEPLVEAVA